MTEANKDVSSRKIFDVDTLAKSVAFFAIVFYIIGFLTTNLYLQQLGFSDFSLLKPRFILTGGLVVFSIALICLCVLLGSINLFNNFFKDISQETQEFIRQTKAVRPFLAPVALLMIVAPLIILAGFLSVNNEELNFSQLILNSLKLYLSGLFLGLITLSPWIVKYVKKRRFTLELRDSYILVWIITVLLIYMYFSILYLGIFSKEIYPKVPEQFGGGKPRKVRILFAKDQADMLKQSGIPTCGSDNTSSNWSKPVNILFEGSENYFLSLADGRPPIQILKKTVSAVEPILQISRPREKLPECPVYIKK